MFLSTKKVLDYLESNQLTDEEHNRLLGILNKNMGIFPISDAIKFSQEGMFMINGQKLNIEDTVKFRAELSNVRDNWAFRVLCDQVTFLAIKEGVHTAETPSKMMFGKSALYFIQKFRELLATYDIR